LNDVHVGVSLIHFLDFHDNRYEACAVGDNPCRKEDFPLVHRLVVTLNSHSFENSVSSGKKNRALFSLAQSMDGASAL
jgi:hypothetical protein